METFIDIFLLTLLALLAVALVAMHRLFAIVMLTALYSLISACFFMTLDAVDVAFTEAAVGAGITTVLFLGVLALIGGKEKPHRWDLIPIVAVLITGAALVYSTLDMPNFGDAYAPIHTHVAPRYIMDSMHEVGPPNMVTSVLASYRGYDTLGEVTVVFTAAIAIILLLGTGRGRWLKTKQPSLSVTYATTALDHEEPTSHHHPEP